MYKSNKIPIPNRIPGEESIQTVKESSTKIKSVPVFTFSLFDFLDDKRISH